ncbi:MAG: hypothetical protein ACHQNT_12365 [Bacteroidia bacterium]
MGDKPKSRHEEILFIVASILATSLIIVSVSHSIIYYDTLYNEIMPVLSLGLLLSGIYFFSACKYFKESQGYDLDGISRYLIILKLILIALLILPNFIDKDFQIIIQTDYIKLQAAKILLEFLKIIGIEILLKIYFYFFFDKLKIKKRKINKV